PSSAAHATPAVPRTNGACKVRQAGLFCHRISSAFTPLGNGNSEFPMSHVTYKIVEHVGGWAYTVNGVFSEPFRTHAAALAAARRAAGAQRVAGSTAVIGYETADRTC